MDNPRSEKVAVVDQVRQRFDDASAAILTEYRGLKVKDLAGLRRSLRASGGDYKIYKNTLVRLAARGSGLVDLEEMLVGPTAIAFVDGDAAAVAKVLRDFARTNPLLVIKGGVLGDKVMDARETTALADLPPREVLLARFAGALAAPMQQLAGLLQALPRNLAYGLAALRDQRAESGDEGAAAETPAVESSSPDAGTEATAADEAGSADAAPVGAQAAEAAGAPEKPADDTGPEAAGAAETPADGSGPEAAGAAETPADGSGPEAAAAAGTPAAEAAAPTDADPAGPES